MMNGGERRRKAREGYYGNACYRQEALLLLAKRRLLSIQRDGITAIPVYEVLRPWMRASPAG
ncbi:MAG: hypothetical protein QOE77_4114 [Blastocatellia bacterium]|jgi:hypothetical protein|nr:hypothetical protein [Blastocatellia bacterium]